MGRSGVRNETLRDPFSLFISSNTYQFLQTMVAMDVNVCIISPHHISYMAIAYEISQLPALSHLRPTHTHTGCACALSIH
jgi:hypothetical protein